MSTNPYSLKKNQQHSYSKEMNKLSLSHRHQGEHAGRSTEEKLHRDSGPAASHPVVPIPFTESKKHQISFFPHVPPLPTAMLLVTCHVPVLGLLVWGAVDEFSEGADGVGAHQGVAPEGSAIHHPDVQGRVEQLVLREVLGSRGGLVSKGWMSAVGCPLWWVEKAAGTKVGVV